MEPERLDAVDTGAALRIELKALPIPARICDTDAEGDSGSGEPERRDDGDEGSWRDEDMAAACGEAKRVAGGGVVATMDRATTGSSSSYSSSSASKYMSGRSPPHSPHTAFEPTFMIEIG